jgi:lipopolysaccharide/colanic/teichoic acid biosynthesis glycosyltransferase
LAPQTILSLAETRDSETAEAPSPNVVRVRRDRPPAARLPVVPEAYAWYPRVKAIVDFLLAALLTVPALPMVLFAALAVKLTSRGPVFYTQTRVGKGGRLFSIIKLRTMFFNCESLTGPRWCVPGDSRITVVGYVLRKTHLDELPQLVNVLRGEMSLIGPRPERPEFIPDLERALPTYRQRLNVRPGVTGLAQVQLAPDTDIESVRRKLAHDLFYVRRLGPWMDLRLLVCTAFYALGLPFGLIRLLGLPASAAIERATRDVVPDTPANRQRQAAC